MKKIKIESEGKVIEVEVAFSDNATSKEILESLPLKSKARTWGDEIYFDIGITAPINGATKDVGVGDIAYWPAGTSLCIFFGPTPASTGDKPVPADKVIIVGKADVDPDLLRRVKSGSKITVE